MPSPLHILGRQRVLAASGIKCAFELNEVGDLRDVERTPTWMHAYNALIDKISGETPDNPLYHPGFAELSPQTLLSMIPPREVTTLERFYPEVKQFMGPPPPAMVAPPPLPEITPPAPPPDESLPLG